MRKSAYTQELVDKITLGLEPLIVKDILPTDNILIIGAGSDLKGISCLNIVLDILEKNNIPFTNRNFYLPIDFDEIDMLSNIQLVEDFFNINIERFPTMNLLELTTEFLNNNLIPDSEKFSLARFKKYFVLNNLNIDRNIYTKVYTVNGHKHLPNINQTNILNDTLLFNSGKNPISVHTNAFNLFGDIINIEPNALLTSNIIDFNLEALNIIETTNVVKNKTLCPDPALDLNLPKSQLVSIISNWKLKYPDRITQILNYEMIQNISFFTTNAKTSKMKFIELLQYLGL